MADKPEVPPDGRKYTLTQKGMVLTVVPLIGIFVLAGLGKATADVSQMFATVLPPYYLAVGALVTGFNASNAYATGKAADAGALSAER